MAQTFSTLTEAHIVYYRAFHGTIEQNIQMTPSGKSYFKTYIFKPNAKKSDEPKIIEKGINEKVLQILISLANDMTVRESCLKTRHKSEPDGSSIAIIVQQNNFQLELTCQDAYDKDGPASSRKIGAAVINILKEAGIQIPPDELY